MPLTLNTRPDAYGWIYGDYVAPNGERHVVNIMPPKDEWAGNLKLPGYEPDDQDYVLYIDGEEVGRMQRLDPVEVAKLLESSNAE